MNSQTFFDNFELLAEAPNGVKKLRELILQLAVMGKLAPQDPNDEPAFVLLEKIKAEKERLVKENHYEKSKSFPPITIGDIDYSIPYNWVWTRCGHMCISIVPNRDKPKSFSGGYPWITLPDFNEKKIELAKVEYEIGLSKSEVKEYNARIIPTNSVIMSCVGRFGLVAVLDKDVVTNQQIHGFVVPDGLNSKYLAYVIKSQKSFLEASATSTTIKYLNKTKCESILLPLPPLAEQHRIVTKVDQLMKLCDELEASQQKKREARITINNTAIAQLLTAREPEEFNKSWQRIYNNFDLLYSTPENIAKLRSCILQLAVMGKLAPQDPNDEPASVLLKKIKAEKERLVKKHDYEKSKSLPPIIMGEIDFRIPDNWIWTRFGHMCISIVPNRDKPKSFSGGYPWITLPDFDEKKIELAKIEYEIGLSNSEVKEYNARVIPTNSVIMSCVGRFGLVAVIDRDVVTNQQIHGFVVPDGLNSKYLAYVIKSQKSFLEASATSTTIKYLNKTKCESILLPLPPLAEQHRIVAKVNQLMTLCDQLEAQLKQTVTDSEKLIETAVRQMLDVNTIAADNICVEPTKLETKTVKQSSKKTQSHGGEAVQLNLQLF